MCCDFDWRYARSTQGICKIGQIFLGLTVWIAIVASPYWNPLFILEGQTWPFHLTLFAIMSGWIATAACFIIFLSGFHYNYANVNWPRIELIVNFLCAILFLFGGVLETLNVWRWDYSHGSPMSYNGGIKNIGYYGRRYMGVTSYGQYGGYGGYGGGQGMMKMRGMSLMQKINYQAHCMRYPRYCRDYHSMLAGYSTYLGNHIFATVFIWIAFISYLVSSWFGWKLYKSFQERYWKPQSDQPAVLDESEFGEWVRPPTKNRLWTMDWGSKLEQGTAKLRDGYARVEKMVMSLRRPNEIPPPTSKPEKLDVLHDRSDQIVTLKTKRNHSANVDKTTGDRFIQNSRRLEQNASPTYSLIEGPCASIVV